MRSLLKSRPILSFISVTFIFTFSLWFLPVFISMPLDIKFALIVLGSCGPLIAGLLITAINSDEKIRIHSKPIFISVFVITTAVLLLLFLLQSNRNRPELEEVSPFGYVIYFLAIFIISLNFSNVTNNRLKENYLKSALYENGKLKWYLLGFTLIISMYLLSYFLGAAIGMQTTDYIFNLDQYWFIGYLAAFLFIGGNEEFGWRGFLQKELQKKYNPLITALIISFFWSLWHLPFHYNGFYDTGGIVNLLPRFIVTIPLAIIYTWLYNKSSYAILAVILLHTTFNEAISHVGNSAPLASIIGLVFAVFCIFYDKMWKKRSFEHIYEKESN